jgi:hypothetical protein
MCECLDQGQTIPLAELWIPVQKSEDLAELMPA